LYVLANAWWIIEEFPTAGSHTRTNLIVMDFSSYFYIGFYYLKLNYSKNKLHYSTIL
jgi:hypothetical protein